jgi:SAM-dependent methyltransferase
VNRELFLKADQMTQVSDFDEDAYLEANPDVATAVRSGALASGALHYALHGKSENRQLKPGVAARDILDVYVKAAPSHQNALDMFAGEWSSKMPAFTGLGTSPGLAELFEDARITWAGNMLGGFAGKTVIELGPLEGGHSYMMHQAGAASILSLEANSRAFMKCLCVKEIFKLDRVEFQLGDFVAYLDKPLTDRFDILIASGILYHMADPIGVLNKMAKITDRIFLWTHYYDDRVAAPESPIARFFEAPRVEALPTHEVISAKRYYGEALDWRGFCGGPEPFAVWLGKDTILRTLEAAGFNRIDIEFDHPDHANGPAFALCATRA